MQASHGSTCSGPPATHTVTQLDDAVYQCNGRIMTAMSGGYGAVYMLPAALVDFTNGAATISMDVSTLRSSGRDYWDVWIMPPADNLQMTDVQGPPRNGIQIIMQGTGNWFAARVFKNGNQTNYIYGGPEYDLFLTPDAARRDTFLITVSKTSVSLKMPGHSQTMFSGSFAALDWTKGMVSIGHQSYNPTKDTNFPNPSAGTWHWDDIVINPAVPVTITHTDHRGSQDGNLFTFTNPTPAGHIRFTAFGPGQTLQLRLNGGAWVNAQENAQQHLWDFNSYWHPIPAGTTTVEFRNADHIRDINAWSI